MPDGEKITWGRLLGEASATLETAGVPDARRAARWLVSDVLGCGPAHLVAYPNRAATPEQAEAIAVRLARRLRHEPVQYILGYADFFGLRLHVTPAVLIPRPETEQVVEAALALLADAAYPRVLDVGTGSGCIALAIRRERPDAVVSACDLSEAALAVARTNAEAHRLAVTFFQADVLAPDFPIHVSGPFDLVISNPPYVPGAEAEELAPEVLDYEPHLALFSGDDPLRFYRAIVGHAVAILAPGGRLVFETHAHYADAVRACLAESGFVDVQRGHDLAGHPRIVTAHASVCHPLGDEKDIFL